MNRFILGSLLFVFPIVLHAQWRGLRLASIGPEEGLTMRVNSVVQDSTGYIYFGGTQGLVRYDGVNFKRFSNIPGDSTTISPGEVYQTIVDAEGIIWATIRFSGLNSFDPKTNKFERYTVPRVVDKMELGCDAILVDEHNDIWVAGQQMRIFKVNRELGALESFHPEWLDFDQFKGRLLIKKMIQDNSNPDIIWLSVTDYLHLDEGNLRYSYGFLSFNRVTKKFTSYPNIGRISHQSSDGEIHSTHLMGRTISFFPADSRIKPIPFRTSEYPKVHLSRSTLDRGENTWILTAYEILKRDNEGFARTLFESQTDDPILNGFQLDASNRLWITTEQGVRYLDKHANTIEFYSLSEFDNDERIYPGRLAYNKNENTIYLAHGKGLAIRRLYRIPLDKKIPASFVETEFTVGGIVQDQEGKVWVTGNGKLNELMGNDMLSDNSIDLQDKSIPWHWNMRINSKGVMGILPIDGFMWFNTHDKKMNSVASTDFPPDPFRPKLRQNFDGFTFDHKNGAIVYSSTVYKIDLSTKQIILLKYDSSFNPNRDEISDVRIDLENHYWISGPVSTAKFKLEGDSLIKLQTFTVKDGLAEAQVTEMHIDYQNRVWCFTSSGMNCIDQKTNEIRYFGVKEGLPQIFIDPRQVITLPDNRIATVNKNGLILFHPDSLWNTQNPQSIQVAINNIRLNGVDVTTNVSPNQLREYSFPSGRNIVDIQFQGFDYPSASQLKYSYRLLGFQDDWLDIGKNNSVTLSGLSSGDFVFQVKAGGVQDSAPIKELKIHIPVPFYKSWWFVLLSLILVGSIIYLIYQRRIEKVRREEAEKTKVNKKIAELELKALRSQMNPHFMFNSLNSIKNFILRSEPKQAAEYLSNFSHLIRMILQNSREKSISLQEELESLMLYIELEQLRFDDEFEFKCEIGEGVQMELTFIPPMILQPYIENAIWHGLMHKKGSGVLSLLFEKTDHHVCCIIEDDGVGRDRAMQLKNKSIRKYKSMGMGITQDRIELVNQMDSLGITVEIIDLEKMEGDQTGTRVVVKIPVKLQNKDDYDSNNSY